MANLSKTNNGLIFYDDFKEQTLMWTLSPSNSWCIKYTEDGLRMKHGTQYCSFTITEPSSDEYSCVVKLDHIPFDVTDIAGVLVMSSTQEYAECQTYMATKPSGLTNADSEEEFIDIIYKYIKIHRIKHSYVFYASHDGYTWIEVGSCAFSTSGLIGFFIYGTESADLLGTSQSVKDNGDGSYFIQTIENSHFYVNSFALFTSKYLTIAGITREYEFELADGHGHILLRTDTEQYEYMYSRSNHECVINTTTLPMPIENASVRVYPKDKYNETTAVYELGETTYGGDVFTLARDIRVYINNEHINQSTVHDLGMFYRGSYYVRMEVQNHEDYEVTNVRVKISRYSEYYGGEEEIDVALYDETLTEDMLDYRKEIIIPAINPSEGKTVYMRLSDKPTQNLFQSANSFRFKIIVE